MKKTVIMSSLSLFSVVLLANGNELYNTKCVSCHGIKGDGLGTNPVLAGQTKNDLIRKIKNHKEAENSSNRMKYITNQLNDKEIEEIANHISTLKTVNEKQIKNSNTLEYRKKDVISE